SALGIIVGLASKAPVTIFDEPYIGLDAAGRKRFYDILLEEYEAHPRTFIFSTHLIDEVSLLFEEVLIFQDGKFIMQESTETSFFRIVSALSCIMNFPSCKISTSSNKRLTSSIKCEKKLFQ